MGDLLDADVLGGRIRLCCRLRQAELRALGDDRALDADALIEEHLALGRRLSPHIAETTYGLHDAIAAGRRILFEGANASLLDVDHGTYPYVTSSNSSTLGIAPGTGVPGSMIGQVVGIMKAYSTRVGGGPMPTELNDGVGDRIRERGREYGTTTGRPRRCGWLDLVAVRYAAMICGVTRIACMLLDVLSGLESLNICTAYRLPDGTVTDRFIPDAPRLSGVEPIYETLPGWNEEIDGSTSRDDLPSSAQAYLECVERFVGVPIEIVSVGPRRSQTVVLA